MGAGVGGCARYWTPALTCEKGGSEGKTAQRTFNTNMYGRKENKEFRKDMLTDGWNGKKDGTEKRGSIEWTRRE